MLQKCHHSLTVELARVQVALGVAFAVAGLRLAIPFPTIVQVQLVCPVEFVHGHRHLAMATGEAAGAFAQIVVHPVHAMAAVQAHADEGEEGR